MWKKIKEFFEDFFSGGDISGIKKTNSYYLNLEVCNRLQKAEVAQKKEDKRIAKQMIKNKKKKR